MIATIIGADGAPIMTISGEEETIAANTPDGGAAIPGAASGDWWDGSAWQTKPPQPSIYHTWDWATHSWVDDRTDEQKAADAAQELIAARTAKTAEINRAAQAAAQALIAGYPDFEQKTWDRQRVESEMWFGATDPTADLVPWCSACAAARGVELVEFMAKVKGNVDVFMTASAQIAGRRQKLADAVAVATTVVEINAISWA